MFFHAFSNPPQPFRYYIVANHYNLNSMNILQKIIKLQKTTRSLAQNWLTVTVKIYLLKKYPVTVKLKNKGFKYINDEGDWWAIKLLVEKFGSGYDVNTDTLNTTYNGTIIVLKGASHSAAVEIFGDKIYEDLNVDGKDVLDIGGNIADSAISFAIRGAKKIIGIEPYHVHYKFAIENIALNKLTNHIIFLNGGAGKENSELSIADWDNVNAASSIQQENNGIKINIYSLKHLVTQFNLVNPILKMDCEGCEYEIINEENIDVLRVFSEIFMEYHFGSVDLEKLLLKSGFSILSITHDEPNYNPKAKQNMRTGLIHAKHI